MTDPATLERSPDVAPGQRAPARVKDDATMLKAAANLTRDLNVPRSSIYWADMLGSAALGYAALFATMALKWPTLLLGTMWASLFTWIIWRLPARDGPWIMLSLVFPAYYVALSLWLQFRR